MKNSSKVLIALGAGIALGGILGLLFAPEKGSDTRQKIADAGKKMADNLKDTVNKSKAKLSGLKDELNARMEAVNDKEKDYV